MSVRMGFVILSHLQLDVLLRLTAVLRRTYGEIPIVVHHDFHQVAGDTNPFGGNVKFVRPPIKTKWADISVVHATLLALRELYASNDPDWFTLLSATDFPIMHGPKVLKELEEGPFDLYMDYQLAERRPVPLKTDRTRIGSSEPEWRRNAYDRYVAKTVMVPPIIVKEANRRPFLIRSNLLLRPFLPYSTEWKCYAGDHWFTGNRKVANILLSETSKSRQTIKHLDGRFCPEESYYQTILANRSDLRICPDNKRYTDWAGQDKHPRTLEIDDLDRMLESRCYFARKFSTSRPSSILDAIERVMGAY
jgi:hypothetical protein